MVAGEMARTWPALATVAGLHAGVAAKQGWRGDGPGLGQAGLRYHDIEYRACACRNTGRCGGRR